MTFTTLEIHSGKLQKRACAVYLAACPERGVQVFAAGCSLSGPADLAALAAPKFGGARYLAGLLGDEDLAKR